MSKMTQRQKIIDYCGAHGSITVREAFAELHINSPTKRISEIRKSGLYDVQAEEESRVNGEGETVRFNRYYISPLEQGSVQR